MSVSHILNCLFTNCYSRLVVGFGLCLRINHWVILTVFVSDFAGLQSLQKLADHTYGGCNKEKHASCYAAQVKHIMAAVQIQDLSQLDRRVTSIEDRWVNVAVQEKRLKAKTLLNYMFSLEICLIF